MKGGVCGGVCLQCPAGGESSVPKRGLLWGRLGLSSSLAAWDLNFPRKRGFLCSQLKPEKGPLPLLLRLPALPRGTPECISTSAPDVGGHGTG